MVSFFHNWSHLKQLGVVFLTATLLSLLSFGILWLEYGVLNFGDSDLRPYQPDTFFEKGLDAVWFTTTGGAGLLWLFIIIYAFALSFRAIKRRMA